MPAISLSSISPRLPFEGDDSIETESGQYSISSVDSLYQGLANLSREGNYERPKEEQKRTWLRYKGKETDKKEHEVLTPYNSVPLSVSDSSRKGKQENESEYVTMCAYLSLVHCSLFFPPMMIPTSR